MEKNLNEIKFEVLKVLHPSFPHYLDVLAAPLVFLCLIPLGVDPLLVLSLFILLESLLAVFSWAALSNTIYVVKKDLVEQREGILVREVRSIPIEKIVDVTVEQTLLQKPFGIGNIFIKTAGASDRRGQFEMAFQGVENPFEVAQFILALKKGGAE